MGLVGYLSSHIQDVTQYSQTKTGEYPRLLKTGSLDNAIREFSLAKPSWCMSHCTMIYKNGERMRDFLGLLFLL